MPLVDRDYISNWDTLYSFRFKEWGFVSEYLPTLAESNKREMIHSLERIMKKRPPGKALFLYCGFGFIPHLLTPLNLSTSNVLVEPSAAVQLLKNTFDFMGNKFSFQPADLLPLDITISEHRDQLKDLGPFDFIIVDFPSLNWFSDSEILAMKTFINNNLVTSGSRIINIVIPLEEFSVLNEETGQDEIVIENVVGTAKENWNMKTRNDWKSFWGLPSKTFFLTPVGEFF